MDLGPNGNTYVQIGFAIAGAAVGAYMPIGAYTGMQLGLAIGGVLFHEKEAKEHTPYNDRIKDTNTITIDPVPVVIGTDLSPGNVIWVNNSPFGLVEPSFYNNEALDNFVSKFPPGFDLKLFHIEFIAVFSNYQTPTSSISRMWLNDLHHWLWARFNDFIHHEYGWFELGWNKITKFDLNLYWTMLNPKPHITYDTPIADVKAVRWWGAMMHPLSNDLTKNAFLKADDEFKAFPVIGAPPRSFPALKAEVTYRSAGGFTPYSGRMGSNRSHVGYTHTYRDNNSHYLYGVLSTGFGENGTPWYNKNIAIRRLNFYTYTYTLLATHEYTWNNITKSYVDGQSISRQDIDGNPDHLYIFHGRNWSNGNTYSHHHANYSLEYDIFYIDRSDDSVHSICYDSRLSVNGDNTESTSRPRIQIRSMEIVGDSILLFGQEHETHSIWDDQRTVTADAEYLPGKKTKIYADFSQYPDGYWVDDTGGVYVWAYMVGNHNPNINTNRIERYKIITQTSTFIIVDGLFSILPKTGNYLHITRVRDHQVGWSIVGVGSTRTKIICNPPSPFSPRISLLPYDSVQFEHLQDAPGLDWGFEIASTTDSSVNLKGTLPQDPIPGDIIWFTHEFHYEGISYPDDKDDFQHFYNPENHWFWRWLYDVFKWEDGGLYEEYNKYFNNGLWNSKHWGKNIILELDKSTGVFKRKLYESYFKSYSYTGIQFICVGEAIQISTVSTDAQIAVSFQIAQPYVYLNNNNLVIDKNTLSVVSSWHNYHSFTNQSHACGKVFRGCVKVRAYDVFTHEYSYRWYALVAEFMARGGVPDSKNWDELYNNDNIGYYLLDLGLDGIFPNMERPLTMSDSEEFSSILNVDANAPQMIKWFRQQITTGPLYSPFFVDQSTIRDSISLRMYDYDEKLFFIMDRGSFVGVNSETWCFQMPNEFNLNGFSWPIVGAYDYSDWGYAQNDEWGDTALSCKYYLGFGGSYFKSHVSNWVDADISTTLGYPIFNGDEILFESASNIYCREIIPEVVNYCGKIHEIFEPRYMFSMCYSRKQSRVSILEDILATFQGISSRCNGRQITVRVPRPDEVSVWHFGFLEQNIEVTQASSFTIIYCDLSDYPENYWKGDYGKFIYNNIVYDFIIKSSYADRIELESSLSSSSAPVVGSNIILIKDNIKEGSFTYAKKPLYGRANRVRVEFVNRLLEYKIDVAEVDDVYKQEMVDEIVIQSQKTLHGIKRATQAGRMALRYLDYEQYVDWMCSFQTDLLGSYLCVGDIISVTHPVTNWFNKEFRIIKKEELQDFEVLLECEEYVRYIYHDVPNTIYQGGGGRPSGNLPVYGDPHPVRRLKTHFDPMTNNIYVTFSEPQNSSSVVGVNIYYKINNGPYQKIGLATTSTASVVYSSTGTSEPSNMEPTILKYNDGSYILNYIPYDPLTMIGTFPASGYVWVNGELIYYGGIDTVNNRFINVIRGIVVPEYQYAVDALDYGYNWTNPLIVLADINNIFSFPFNISSIDLTAESNQTEGSQIQYNIPIITVMARSFNITGIETSIANSPTSTMYLPYSFNRPLPPTLLRFSRDF